MRDKGGTSVEVREVPLCKRFIQGLFLVFSTPAFAAPSVLAVREGLVHFDAVIDEESVARSKHTFGIERQCADLRLDVCLHLN